MMSLSPGAMRTREFLDIITTAVLAVQHDGDTSALRVRAAIDDAIETAEANGVAPLRDCDKQWVAGRVMNHLAE